MVSLYGLEGIGSRFYVGFGVEVSESIRRLISAGGCPRISSKLF